MVSGIAAVCVFAYVFYFGISTYGYPWAIGIGWLRSLIAAVLTFGVVWVLLWFGALALRRVGPKSRVPKKIAPRPK